MDPKRLLNLDFLKLPFNTELFQIKAKEVGLPPGTLIHVGKQKIEKPVIDLVDYDQQQLDTRRDISLTDVSTFKETSSVSWINLSGIHDIKIIEQFGQQFGLHALALEDILNTQHRPKVEEMEGYSLIILKMLFFDDKTQSIDTYNSAWSERSLSPEDMWVRCRGMPSICLCLLLSHLYK